MDHVSDEQPLIHLFTVGLDEVKRRVSTGGKSVNYPKKKEANK